MIELGKSQELEIIREKDFGVYLGKTDSPEESVLLPKKQVPEGAKTGDRLKVFIYKDSEDRLIATTAEPRLEVSETAVLTVKEVGKIGAFLDMGLEKDLLLPFKEQNHKVEPGEQCLVALYVDKSSRLAATMDVYPYLSNQSPYKKDDWVEGRVYEIKENLGTFVAVDDKYFGMIPAIEHFRECQAGEKVKARVVRVREDGKLDLSMQEKAYLQMDVDAEQIMKVIERFDGVLPFNDKADPRILKKEFGMSKNAFKRAIGRLLKERRVEISGNQIKKI